MEARFGVDILDGLGSTEMLHIFLSNAPDDVAYGTTGRAVPGYELRLLDEAGKAARDDEVGELYGCGARRRPTAIGATAKKSRRTFQGEWTRTGDFYTRDADGRYTYSGRADDMFKVSGVWVSPFEVEAALADHPAVQIAAVVPAEDADGLLKPKAFVVLRQAPAAEGSMPISRSMSKKSVGPWKYPRWIVFVDALPMTATGKIQRFKLREPQS